ncbi:MAG: 5-formyltetrahydrofolate cyclo-ligase [Oceanospirillaceae bacterium]|nr:5-formyltetrahydrofolate cyclo-ligase [Oceanospirillaceae bacterium]
MSQDNPNTRQQLRREMRRLRRGLSAREQRQASSDLLRRLTAMPLFHRARNIALYLPNDGEIDPTPLIEFCWRQGKRTFLPVLHPIRHNRLWFVPYTRNTPMQRNIYRILEPKISAAPRRPALGLDLVLLPLVAFDASGARMGMGGGYYDRTFAFKQRKGPQGPALIGLAHDFQRVESLPVASWDIPLAGIVTDQGRYGFRR